MVTPNLDIDYLNPLSAKPTIWSKTLNLSAVADELFEWVWQFCEVGAQRVVREVFVRQNFRPLDLAKSF